MTTLIAVFLRAVFVLLYATPGFAALGMGGGDGFGYHRLALSFLKTGLLNDPLFLARPPLFPLFIASLFYLTNNINPSVIILANLLLSSATAGLTFVLASRLGLSFHIALISGLLVALDPSSAYYGICPLSEAMFGFLLILGLFFFAKSCVPGNLHLPTFFTASLAGITFGLAMLVKPVAMLYWLVPSSILIFFRQKRRESILIIAFSLTCLAGWTLHNKLTWGIPTFSSAGTWNMLFIRGVGVLNRVSDEPPRLKEKQLVVEIEKRIGNTVTVATAASPQDYLETTDPRRLAAMRDLAWRIYREHLGWYLLMIPVGLVRMFFGVPFSFTFSLVVKLIYAVIYLAGLTGIYTLWKQERRDVAFLIGATIGYFSMITVTAQTAAAGTRFCIPFFPLLAIAASSTICNLLSRTAAGILKENGKQSLYPPGRR